MLSVEEAESIIFNLVKRLDDQQDVERLDLLSASGRVLAAPVVGSMDFPHWDNSAMDGYAVRYADVSNSSPERPTVLTVVEEIPAGKPPQVEIKPGLAARILTGSMMPPGADTVVMQEETRRQGQEVEILAAPREIGDFVRHGGSFYRAGNPLLPAGIAIAPPDIAVLATAQCLEVPVYRRPKVAILSTGDELVTPGASLKPGQLVDSNQYALTAAVIAAGCEAIPLGIVPDDPGKLKQAIAHALSVADVVLSTGGVSVGDYDYVEQILTELGGQIQIKSVAIKPGKPLTVATFPPSTTLGDSARNLSRNLSSNLSRNLLYFGLPGNPVSALVTFWRFVQPALGKLSGLNNGFLPEFSFAKTQQDLRAGGQRETYLWGQIHSVDSEYRFEVAGGSHSSGNLINLAQTNGLAIVPVGKKLIPAGEMVQVMRVK
jgi:molybdopterin molybdotransferase